MLAEHFILFRNEFDKCDSAGARMLDSIYHMTLRLLKNHIFVAKASIYCHLLGYVIMYIIMLRF